MLMINYNMMRVYRLLLTLCTMLPFFADAQRTSLLPQQGWVDSVFNSLTEEQRIAQLIVIRAHSNLGADHVAKVQNDITKYNVGALCFFQGGPVRQGNPPTAVHKNPKTTIILTKN